ncbi:uncharacterized protein LOC144767621 [Lissotriton helveticus]
MSRAAPMWVFGLLLACQVLLGRSDEHEESPEGIFPQLTPENITAQIGQTVIFQCVTQRRTPVVFFIFRNGFSTNIACPGPPPVVPDPRIEAACSPEAKDGLWATWTIKDVAKADDRAQVICTAEGQMNKTSFLIVEEAAVAEYTPISIAAPVVGGFLGFLLIFALIVCCLICCARCRRSEEEDEKKIVTSFSNPSWSGNTNSTLEKGSIPNDYEEPEKTNSSEQPSKQVPVAGAISGHSESTSGCPPHCTAPPVCACLEPAAAAS